MKKRVGYGQLIILKTMISVFLCSLLLSSVSFASTLIISDIDDTIKDSEVLHKIRSIKKAFRTDLVFGGMNDLYNNLIEQRSNKNESATIVYLSNAPEKGIGKYHRYFVKRHAFPVGEVLLKRKIFDKNHKFNSIDHLLKTLRPKRVILIGDNGQEDPQIYREVEVKLFPKYHVKNYVTFIRFAYPESAGGSKIYKGQNFFLSASDIALYLYRSGYFDAEVTFKILRDSAFDLILPRWVDCRQYLFNGEGPFLKESKTVERELFNPFYDLHLNFIINNCVRFDFSVDDDIDD